MLLKFELYYFVNFYLLHRLIGLVSRVFTDGPGDRGSIQWLKNGTWYLLA